MYNFCKYIKSLENDQIMNFLHKYFGEMSPSKLKLSFKHWIQGRIIFVKDLINENVKRLNELSSEIN